MKVTTEEIVHLDSRVIFVMLFSSNILISSSLNDLYSIIYFIFNTFILQKYMYIITFYILYNLYFHILYNLKIYT